MEKAVIAKPATATVYAAITDADEIARAEAAFLANTSVKIECARMLMQFSTKQDAAAIDAAFKAIDVYDSRSQPCAPQSWSDARTRLCCARPFGAAKLVLH